MYKVGQKVLFTEDAYEQSKGTIGTIVKVCEESVIPYLVEFSNKYGRLEEEWCYTYEVKALEEASQ